MFNEKMIQMRNEGHRKYCGVNPRCGMRLFFVGGGAVVEQCVRSF